MTDPIESQPRQIVTRAEAMALGLQRYFTGAPCCHGHISERSVDSYGCICCRDLRTALWARSNPDSRRIIEERHKAKNGARINARNRTRDRCRYANNPKRNAAVKAAAKKRRMTNPEDVVASNAAWRKRNKALIRTANRNNKARRKGAIGSYTDKDIAALFNKQKGKCAYFRVCKTMLGNKYHQDHILALIKGGSNFISNIQLTCPSCNIRKKDNDAIAFAQKIGLLI